jgi:hypothetical protein
MKPIMKLIADIVNETTKFSNSLLLFCSYMDKRYTSTKDIESRINVARYVPVFLTNFSIFEKHRFYHLMSSGYGAFHIFIFLNGTGTY